MRQLPELAHVVQAQEAVQGAAEDVGRALPSKSCRRGVRGATTNEPVRSTAVTGGSDDGPTATGICQEATSKLWSGLAHRHYGLNRRAALLHDLVRLKGPTVEPDKTAPWRIAAGYPELITLVGLFASAHWRRSILSNDLLAATQALAEFHRRFPLQTPLRGTSHTWLSTTITATATQIEALLDSPREPNGGPASSAGSRSLRPSGRPSEGPNGALG